MLADSNRVQGYKEAIYKYCKDKIVLDFGAGTGLLGLLAFKAGAKEVWFVEQENVMREYIKNHCTLNGFNDFKIVENISDLPKGIFEVVISETFGDNVIEESIIFYNQVILNNPGCVAIPDEVNFYHEVVSLVPVNNFYKNINSYGLRFNECFTSLNSPIDVQIYGLKINNSRNIFSLSLMESLPIIVDFNVIPPIFENSNSSLIWWEARTKGDYVTSNSPHLDDNGFNHWKQLLIPANRNYRLFFKIKTGKLILDFK